MISLFILDSEFWLLASWSFLYLSFLFKKGKGRYYRPLWYNLRYVQHRERVDTYNTTLFPQKQNVIIHVFTCII